MTDVPNSVSVPIEPVQGQSGGSIFWKGGVWNPTCGRVSLQRGAKLFLFGYAILMFILVAFYIINLILGLVVLSQNGSLQLRGMSGIPGLVDRLGNYKRKFSYESLTLLIVSMLLALVSGILAWRCKKAMEQGSVESMKNNYVILFIIVVLDIIGSIVADCASVWQIALLVTPYTTVTVIGMVFVYSYIVECIITSNQNSACFRRNIDVEQNS